jgi:hypothetical protein
MHFPRPVAAALILLPLLPLIACGPSSKRDADVPARAVTYDDACGLQDYFDERRASNLPAPSAADESVAIDEKGLTAGVGTYVLADAMARRRFGKILRDEYKGIEPQIVAAVEASAGEVKVRVKWWDAGATRRLRVGQEIIVITKAGTTELPPNPCVADMLFGAKIYDMRYRYIHGETDRAAQPEGTPAGTAATTAPSAPPPPAATTSEPAAPSASVAPVAPVASVAPAAAVSSAAPSTKAKPGAK